MALILMRCFIFIYVCSLSCVSFVKGKSNLLKLDESDWDRMLEGEWMVQFHAPWCPACKALLPLWEEFSEWSKDLGISVAQVDITVSPGLSGRFMVTALPTIFHVSNGEFRQYRGSRDKESFISFIEENKWKTVDAVPSWKSPASLQMTVVSHFFKLSQLLRSLHNRLMEEYGLPTWGSYLIFAVATIFVGAMLGLVMVFLIDLVYPPKKHLCGREEYEKVPKDKGDSGEESDGDLVEDEIVDEISSELSNAARKRRAQRIDTTD